MDSLVSQKISNLHRNQVYIFFKQINDYFGNCFNILFVNKIFLIIF